MPFDFFPTCTERTAAHDAMSGRPCTSPDMPADAPSGRISRPGETPQLGRGETGEGRERRGNGKGGAEKRKGKGEKGKWKEGTGKGRQRGMGEKRKQGKGKKHRKKMKGR